MLLKAGARVTCSSLSRYSWASLISTSMAAGRFPAPDPFFFFLTLLSIITGEEFGPCAAHRGATSGRWGSAVEEAPTSPWTTHGMERRKEVKEAAVAETKAMTDAR